MFGKSRSNTQAEDLQALLERMRQAAAGDMAAAEAGAFHDPQVAAAYNDFLKASLKANNVFVMRMNNAMTEIGDSSVVKNMIEEVNAQSRVADTIHSSGQELEKSITNVQYAVQNIQKSSHDVIDTTQGCAAQIRDSIQAIDATAEEVEALTAQVTSFKTSAEQITKIIDQIKDLADNSSLLALNASIEAARAGESGRGFAVVAQQMGVQSNDTASCADAVVTYVNELLDNLDGIVRAIHTTSEHLRAGTLNANASVGSLSEMVEQVEGINTDIDAIFDEVNTQSALTEEFIALGNTVAGGFERMNQECFTTGEHLYKISRLVDGVRSDMARSRAELTMLDWITVFEVDHLIFTWRQYNNLIGFEHLKLEQVNNPKGCKLGKWFAAQTDPKVKGSAAFRRAYDCHEELHRHAVDCFHASERSDREEALTHFEQAYSAYGQLRDALEDLKRDVRAAGYSGETDIRKKK